MPVHFLTTDLQWIHWMPITKHHTQVMFKVTEISLPLFEN